MPKCWIYLRISLEVDPGVFLGVVLRILRPQDFKKKFLFDPLLYNDKDREE